MVCLLLSSKGKHPDIRVEVLPMDLSSDEESLKEVVHAAESLFSSAGIDYMIHNAAFERPVNIIILILLLFYLPKSLVVSLVHYDQFSAC